MALDIRVALGVGGVAPGDSHEAIRWAKRLHWLMILVALLSLPAFYLEEFATDARLHIAGRVLEACVFLAFASEFAWMLHVSRQRAAYVSRNWLDLLIILSAGASLLGLEVELVAVARLARLALAALLLARAAAAIGGLFAPGRAYLLVIVASASMLMSAAGFYWLEPTIHSFWDGLWFAFVTGATVGYGDVVPTTVGARIFAVVSVLVGFTLLSLMTAAVVARFVGEDEKRLRQEMHADIRRLRADIALLVSDEEKAMRRDVRAEIRRISAELEELRAEIARLGRRRGREG